MTWPTLRRRDAPADVVLLLEGTYPMVRGGVSAWVDQLIRGLPDLRFALVFLGGRREHYEGILFERPANVVHLECHYMMDDLPTDKAIKARRGKKRTFTAVREFHETLRHAEPSEQNRALCDMARMLGRRGGLSQEDFLYSQSAWQQIVDHYLEHVTEPSFIDYFWSVRNIHAPLFLLARIAHNLPRGRCLHTISTGYAGFLGALAHHIHHHPLLVTEHGIYTKERQIDLLEAKWIKTSTDALSHGFQIDTGYIRQMWIRFFQGLGRMTYTSAAQITALHEGNRLRQLQDGAPAERTRLIPNGINIDRFAPLRDATAHNQQPIVALLGRVTPIKDIKTFIRAMRQLSDRLPEAQGWIVGPTSEDPDYAQECHDLVVQLGLEDRVRFLGFQRTEEILAQVRLVVLTSISEAQPLVILEAMAAGIPLVCSDVGACREMVLGDPKNPRAAGSIVPIASPQATAQAIYDLLTQQEAWQAARNTGIARVEAEYTEALMMARYQQLYQEVIHPVDYSHRKDTSDLSPIPALSSP
ncbi:MAG: GT4 family glycosyltransferase PelF [Pseudomonadota bacterium]